VRPFHNFHRPLISRQLHNVDVIAPCQLSRSAGRDGPMCNLRGASLRKALSRTISCNGRHNWRCVGMHKPSTDATLVCSFHHLRLSHPVHITADFFRQGGGSSTFLRHLKSGGVPHPRPTLFFPFHLPAQPEFSCPTRYLLIHGLSLT
jgi:hypothetical protein